MNNQDTVSIVDRCSELADKNRDLVRNKEKLETLNKIFLEAAESQGVTLAENETKIAALKEENTRLKSVTVQTSSAEMKTIKTLNKDLVKNNKEMKAEIVTLKAFRDTIKAKVEKIVAAEKAKANAFESSMICFRTDYNRTKMILQAANNLITTMKATGSDAVSAKQLLDLRGKLESKVYDGILRFVCCD
jgi:hypothetical protein